MNTRVLSLCMNLGLHFSWVYLRVKLLGHVVTLYVLLFEDLPDYFTKQLHQFTSQVVVYEDSNLSTSLPPFAYMSFQSLTS